MNTAFEEKQQSDGPNLKRIREIMGYSPESLGERCPSKYTADQVLAFEERMQIDEPLLDELADALGVSSTFIRRYKEEIGIFNIQSNNQFDVRESSAGINNQPKIHYETSEKLISAMEGLTVAVKELMVEVKELMVEVRKLKS